MTLHWGDYRDGADGEQEELYREETHDEIAKLGMLDYVSEGGEGGEKGTREKEGGNERRKRKKEKETEKEEEGKVKGKVKRKRRAF